MISALRFMVHLKIDSAFFVRLNLAPFFLYLALQFFSRRQGQTIL